MFRGYKTGSTFNSVDQTYEKSASARVCGGALCCLFYSDGGFGLLLPRPLLPI
jgi:hypothetical protein